MANPSIEVLNLSGTKVTSNGLKKITTLKKLKILTLEDTRLENNVESILSSIPKLKVLYINSFSMNKKSSESLAKKIPWSAIYFEKNLVSIIE